MRVTLHVNAGPAAGRVIHLRPGQIAQFGRTEWADFSFPQDSSMAEVHFALECGLQGCLLRDLNSPSGTLVNGQRVPRAELGPGDRITAGQTTLAVLLDGKGADQPAVAEAVSAAAPAGREPVADAVSLSRELELDEQARALAEPGHTPEQLLAALGQQEQFEAALRVQAHLLAKPQAVAWALQCVEQVLGQVHGEDLPRDQVPSLEAVRHWLRDPSDEHRRAAGATADAAQYEGPASWLALGVFCSGGSLAPPELEPVPPDPRLTGQALTTALLLAASYADPLEAPGRCRSFLQQGQQP